MFRFIKLYIWTDIKRTICRLKTGVDFFLIVIVIEFYPANVCFTCVANIYYINSI